MNGALKALAVGSLVLGCGCTSLQWAEMAPDAIRQGIHDGELMQVGDRVGVVDRNGKEHVVRVAAITPDSVLGEPSRAVGELRKGEVVEIAIDDIVALRTLRPDRGRTTAAAMTGTAFGSMGLMFVLIILACV